jgi:hypothetical protein
LRAFSQHGPNEQNESLAVKEIGEGPNCSPQRASGSAFHERLEKKALRARRNAAVTNSALDLAGDPSGSVDTSSRPIRVDNPNSMACLSNGQAEASVPCNKIGF